MGRPTNRKSSAKPRAVKQTDDDGDDARAFDVRTMTVEQLTSEAVGRHLVEALESRDIDKWRRAISVYYAAQGWGAPTFQANAVIRGKSPASDAAGIATDIKRRATLMYEVVDAWLARCTCHADDLHVAFGLLQIFSFSNYMFDCHPEAPTWRDVTDYVELCADGAPVAVDSDLVKVPLTVTAIAREIAPIRRRNERPDPEKITRAVARVLGMSKDRVKNLFPGLPWMWAEQRADW